MNKTHQNLLAKISYVVKARREALHISQEALADIAEIDRSYTSQIERGIANPSLQVLCKLATALNLSLGQLLGEIEIKQSNFKEPS